MTASNQNRPVSLKTDFYNEFRNRIWEHYSKSSELHELKNYEDNKDLLEEVLDLETEILKSFGLPPTASFMGMIDLFSWQETICEDDIEQLYREIIEQAEVYLSSPTKSDKQILIEAKQNNLTAHDALPQTDIQPNTYTVFLYEDLFYSNDFPIDLILDEMKKGNTIPLKTLLRLDTPLLLKGKLDKEVQTIGLAFWADFVKRQKIEQRCSTPETIDILDNFRYSWYGVFPKAFVLTSGYLSTLKAFNSNKPYVLAEIATLFDLGWMNIHVYISLYDCFELLKKSRNKSQACLIRSMLLQFKQDQNNENEISIRDSYETYLFCEGLSWNVSLTKLEDDGFEIEDHNYYELDGFADYLSDEQYSI